MKLTTDIYIAGCGHYLPESRITTSDAIANGDYRQEDQENGQYDAIAVETQHYPAEMALMAIQDCIGKANLPIQDLASLSYTSIHRHGNKSLWSPACYLLRELELTNVLPFNLNQGCNGQMIALQLGIHQLIADPSCNLTLSVAADTFSHSACNRWQDDYCIVYGDGAGAIALSKEPGIAKIKAINTVVAPQLEELHRIDSGFKESPEALRKTHNIREAKKAYLDKYGKESLTQQTQQAMKTLYQQTIEDNNIHADQIAYFILPNLGHSLLANNYGDLFFKHNNLWKDFGAKVGHLGAGDCVIGLSHLLANNQLQSGDLVVMQGAGAGFTWSSVLIEIQ